MKRDASDVDFYPATVVNNPVLNSTSTNATDAQPSGPPSLFDHPLYRTISSDIFSGQIIASIIVLTFVAIFLLREWITQNARPGVFEDGDGGADPAPDVLPLPELPPPQPPVHLAPPALPRPPSPPPLVAEPAHERAIPIRAHYDTDNPPPKVVQGYKFNIFYPDLIDKSKAPTYKIIKEPGNDETVLLHFSAGPPYEDIAFRIVNREWEFSHKR